MVKFIKRHEADLEMGFIIAELVFLCLACLLIVINAFVSQGSAPVVGLLVAWLIMLCLSMLCLAVSKLIPYICQKYRKPIYTHNIAALICEQFEDVLDEHNIKIPDEDRTGDESEGCLYGMTYSNLLENVESIVVDYFLEYDENALLITDVFE